MFIMALASLATKDGGPTKWESWRMHDIVWQGYPCLGNPSEVSVSPKSDASRRSPTTVSARSSHNSEQGTCITTLVYPYKVLAADYALEHLIGFSRRELIGKNMRIMQGHRTEMSMLETVVSGCDTEKMQELGILLTLYTRDGDDVRLRVTSRNVQVPCPDGSGDMIQACQLQMWRTGSNFSKPSDSGSESSFGSMSNSPMSMPMSPIEGVSAL